MKTIKEVAAVIGGMQAQQDETMKMLAMISGQIAGTANVAQPTEIPAQVAQPTQVAQPAVFSPPVAKPETAKTTAKHPDEYDEIGSGRIYERPNGSRYLLLSVNLDNPEPTKNGKAKTMMTRVKGCLKATLPGCFVNLSVCRNDECFNDAEIIKVDDKGVPLS